MTTWKGMYDSRNGFNVMAVTADLFDAIVRVIPVKLSSINAKAKLDICTPLKITPCTESERGLSLCHQVVNSSIIIL